jgi:hypothetical protein
MCDAMLIARGLVSHIRVAETKDRKGLEQEYLTGSRLFLLLLPSLQLWQEIFAHMPCLIFRHSHLNAEFHILLDFIVQAYAFIKEPASLKAVKTIFFARAAVFLCPMIFRFPEGHTATLTHWSRGKFHIFN